MAYTTLKTQTTDKLFSAGKSIWGYFTTTNKERNSPNRNSPRFNASPEITSVAAAMGMEAA